MNNYAFLDDSLQIQNNLYIYSHALVFASEDIETLVISGSKEKIYSQERQIYNFLCDNLGSNDRLIACKHYEKYSDAINNLIYSYFQDLPNQIFNSKKKYFKKLFNLAHDVAKQTAKNYEEYKSLTDCLFV
jgi:hypothetical protein